MGRGRGKGKKPTIFIHEDPGSGEEEKIPIRRRGRPQKPLKDEIQEEAISGKVKEEEEDGEHLKGSPNNKGINNQAAVENGRKRKRHSQVGDGQDLVKEENGVGTKTSANESTKAVGFRQNGSRRKSKPRRAAEVGVECR